MDLLRKSDDRHGAPSLSPAPGPRGGSTAGSTMAARKGRSLNGRSGAPARFRFRCSLAGGRGVRGAVRRAGRRIRCPSGRRGCRAVGLSVPAGQREPMPLCNRSHRRFRVEARRRPPVQPHRQDGVGGRYRNPSSGRDRKGLRGQFWHCRSRAGFGIATTSVRRVCGRQPCDAHHLRFSPSSPFPCVAATTAKCTAAVTK